MKKAMIVAAVMAVSGLLAVSARAQTIYNDQVETLLLSTNVLVVGGNVTNTTTTLVVQAATGAASYSRIDIVPSTNVCLAFNREASTNDVQITTAGYSFKILSVVGGPYRRDAIYLRDTRGTTNASPTASVSVWQINKQ